MSNKVLAITGEDVARMKMSDKILTINRCMESLCADYQKSDLHNNVLDHYYPYADSLDETSARTWSWYEDVLNGEKVIPVISKRVSVEMIQSETFINWSCDEGALVFVKDLGFKKEYFFRHQMSDSKQTFYYSVDETSSKPVEEVIKNFIEYKYENTCASTDSELEFLEWMTK